MKEKLKAFFNEFKEFALKGNVVSMAVGIIIGAAFSAIITAFTDDFINPLINAICGGGVDEEWAGKIPLWGSGQYLAYGDFVSAVINFLMQAFILFLVLKFVNTLTNLRKKPEEEPAPTTKVCPFCKSEINIEATKCAFCTSVVPIEEVTGTKA
jgi:large conductance mechanosensitive channel